MTVLAESDNNPFSSMGEGWDEGDTPHLSPLPQGEKMPLIKTVVHKSAG